ncbi:fimbrial protein [Lysobacter pythonis]|uniref:Fimbrial protein n=1 Tax=Solilutibacter pythonis TaxID=2483112 RepID=A0A3M2I473_9GAMM|nr:pilus assembly protein PilP [Lysobacter pythonis]RMH93287.1 fimbrial protein [Lysobacter pythonis]
MRTRPISFLGLGCVVLLSAGCGRDITDSPGDAPNLVEWVAQVRARPAPPLEPIPVIKPFETFQFDGSGIRDPFDPEAVVQNVGGTRPDSDRRRQPLEAFPLDSLDMVGTLGRGRGVVGLVMGPDKVTYRVSPGNYLGQSDGRVVAVYEDRIELIELVSDGAGGWLERPATITLENQ